MADHLEVEETFEAPVGGDLPVLSGLPEVVAVTGPEQVELEATYFDTAGLDLVGAGITLRRRVGGEDEGWHVKLPTDTGRWEVHQPVGGDDSVPSAMLSVLDGVTRGRALEPVALVRTHRAVHRLHAADDTLLAEVCDDRVTAQSPPGGVETPRSWREWEVELVAGDTGLLTAVGTRLSEAGAQHADVQSKLVRALGDRAPSAALSTEAGTRSQDRTAAALVDEWIRGLVGQLRRYDPLVRADAPDAVHTMRVAIRRLRSALATYRPLLDRQVTDPLRIDLRWISGVLGDARDAEVLRERLLADLDHLPPEDVRGPIRDFLDEELAKAYRRAHERAVESMSTDRYLGLLDRLDQLVDDPPRRGGGGKDGPAVLRRRVRHDWKRLAGRVDALDGMSGEEYVTGLHEVRKAAKRARYAAEPLVPVAGKDAKRFVKAMKGLQSSLGRHQDSVVVEEQLRLLADRAAAAGVNAFTLGRLQPPVEADAAEQQARFPSDWRRASRKRLRTWTR